MFHVFSVLEVNVFWRLYLKISLFLTGFKTLGPITLVFASYADIIRYYYCSRPKFFWEEAVTKNLVHFLLLTSLLINSPPYLVCLEICNRITSLSKCFWWKVTVPGYSDIFKAYLKKCNEFCTTKVLFNTESYYSFFIFFC